MSKSTIGPSCGCRMAKGALSVVVPIAALLAMNCAAHAYPAKVKNACRGDYYRFCPKYHEDSAELKACMRSAGGNISRKCRDALADGGFIARKYHSSILGR